MAKKGRIRVRRQKPPSLLHFIPMVLVLMVQVVSDDMLVQISLISECRLDRKTADVYVRAVCNLAFDNIKAN